MMNNTITSLKGQILIAMPSMEDSRFHKTVIYICEHTEDGTMGIVLNRAMKDMSFSDILEQVQVLGDKDDMPEPSGAPEITVHRGGPVETGRGFVLHTDDYHIEDSTHRINDKVSLTETLEILKVLARGEGPKKAFFALGYAGWSAGQLESEIQQNSWLNSEATHDLIFNSNPEAKYDAALAHLGIDPALLSTSSGHA
ncbi:MAG: YqgE/AlgH family protein [Hyphomicrobiales bacterium]